MSHCLLKSKFFVFSENHLLLSKQDDEYSLFETHPEVVQESIVAQVNLGVHQEHHCVGMELHEQPKTQLCDAFWVPLRQAFELLGDAWFQVAVKSLHLIQWSKQHRYCGQCGQKTKRKEGVFELACKTCNLTFYPRISPSVIVRIHRGDKVLMARSPHFTPGVYGFIAGFVEPGETLEQAVHREVMEEVGLTIKNLRYFGSQPWPFPDSLMMAFTADYAGGELQFNDGEIEAADWYDRDHLPGGPSSKASIASQLYEQFRRSM